MGESAGAWGDLARHDDEQAELWDTFIPLPEPGANLALDAFVERKHVAINSLVRLGARLANAETLAFAFPGGLKFRDLVTDRRWAYAGSVWRELKIVPHGPTPTEAVIVCEGETDGAKLSEVYPCDVAVLPAGAGYFPDAYAAQLHAYKQVLVGLDADSAGERGAKRILEAVPQAQRFAPPAKDWCETEEFPPLPAYEERLELKVLVPAGELLDLEPPPTISWFEQALLPVAGQLILHGWAKSFKSFLALDLCAALAQGEDWATFEPTEEPCRVAVMQYEIPWAYYQQRVRALRCAARHPDLFDLNFLTFTPLQRPRFVAGNVEQEDYVLRNLESHDVQVFLLDPVRRATGIADLNSEKEVRPLLAFFQRLQDNGVTVISCHHDNKTAARSGGGDPLGMTGVGAFAGDADTIVSVSIPKGMTVDEPTRNLHFTLRNAPSPAPRGMSMGDDGRIVYSPSPHGAAEDAGDGPAI